MYSSLGQPRTLSRYRGSAASPNLIAKSAYFSYDDLNRLKGLTHKNPSGVALASYAWDFDQGDRLTTVNYQYGSATYTYDETDQIKLGSHVYTGPPANINEAYTYDLNGNRTGVFQSGAGNRLTTYQFSASPLSTYTYKYEDDEGNRTQREKKVSGVVTERVLYTWDHRNRLMSVETYSGGGLLLTMAATYTYDAFNRRIAKQVDADGGGVGAPVTTQYAYDGDNILFVFAGSGGAAALSTRYLTGPAMDEVYADEAGGQARWPLTDQLGTVRELVDHNAVKIKEWRYDAYGNIAYESAAGIVVYAYGYHGREFEIETGMVFLRRRYYEPGTGKFISEDSDGFKAGDPNFYRYVGNHPSYANDPDGMQERVDYRIVTLPNGVVAPQRIVKEMPQPPRGTNSAERDALLGRDRYSLDPRENFVGEAIRPYAVATSVAGSLLRQMARGNEKTYSQTSWGETTWYKWPQRGFEQFVGIPLTKAQGAVLEWGERRPHASWIRKRAKRFEELGRSSRGLLRIPASFLA